MMKTAACSTAPLIVTLQARRGKMSYRMAKLHPLPAPALAPLQLVSNSACPQDFWESRTAGGRRQCRPCGEGATSPGNGAKTCGANSVAGRHYLSQQARRHLSCWMGATTCVAMPCKHGCMLNVLCFPQNAAAPHFRVTAHMVAARAQGSTLVPIRAHVTPPPHVARPSMGAAPVPAAVGTA
jgi:hypothetical protein